MLMLQIAESHGQREVSQIHIWINLCLKKRPIQWKLLFYVSTTHDHKYNNIIFCDFIEDKCNYHFGKKTITNNCN